MLSLSTMPTPTQCRKQQNYLIIILSFIIELEANGDGWSRNFIMSTSTSTGEMSGEVSVGWQDVQGVQGIQLSCLLSAGERPVGRRRRWLVGIPPQRQRSALISAPCSLVCFRGCLIDWTVGWRRSDNDSVVVSVTRVRHVRRRCLHRLRKRNNTGLRRRVAPTAAVAGVERVAAAAAY